MQSKIPTRNDAWVRWARLIGALFVAATVLALMSGCARAEDATPEERSRLAVYTDPANGCQYLRPLGYSGLAPRMDRDGKQVCR